mmetsp:Transcript_32192/g.72279  ORF Transcript_32192/g.72279 Transcript_32192/m.72279 type:complete len:284 (+) Transcript_32192:77-928(+)
MKSVSVLVLPLMMRRSSSRYVSSSRFMGPRLFQWSALSLLGPYITRSGVTLITFDSLPVNNETSVRRSQSPVIFTSVSAPRSLVSSCSVYSTSLRNLVEDSVCRKPPNLVKPPASPDKPSLYFIVEELEYINSHSPVSWSLVIAPSPVTPSGTTTWLYGSRSSSPTTSRTRSCSSSEQSKPQSCWPSSSASLAKSSRSSKSSSFSSFSSIAGSASSSPSSSSSKRLSIESKNDSNPSSSSKSTAPGAFGAESNSASTSAWVISSSFSISLSSPQRFISSLPTR